MQRLDSDESFRAERSRYALTASVNGSGAQQALSHNVKNELWLIAIHFNLMCKKQPALAILCLTENGSPMYGYAVMPTLLCRKFLIQ